MFDGAPQADTAATSAPVTGYAASGSGSGGQWTETTVTGTRILRNDDTGPTEVAIPLGDAGIAPGDDFNLVVYVNDPGNGIDQVWPPENPVGQSPDLTHFLNYTLLEGAEPYGRQHLSLRTTQGQHDRRRAVRQPLPAAAERDDVLARREHHRRGRAVHRRERDARRDPGQRLQDPLR